jgi:hypothetical protein
MVSFWIYCTCLKSLVVVVVDVVDVDVVMMMMHEKYLIVVDYCRGLHVSYGSA